MSHECRICLEAFIPNKPWQVLCGNKNCSIENRNRNQKKRYLEDPKVKEYNRIYDSKRRAKIESKKPKGNNCKHCGSWYKYPFTKKNNKEGDLNINRAVKYCSLKCKQKSKSVRLQGNGLVVFKGEIKHWKKVKKHECKICNNTFDAEKLVIRNGKKFKQYLNNALYCSNKCRKEATNVLSRERWWQEEREKYLKKKRKGNCVVCGLIYHTFNGRQKTCLKKECQRESHQRGVRVNKGQEEIPVDKIHKIKCEYDKCGKVFSWTRKKHAKGNLPKHCSRACVKNKHADNVRHSLDHKIKSRLRSRVRSALVNNARGKINKAKKTEELLGCKISELKSLFSQKFTQGMSWKKFLAGEIHIDHIKPCISFDLTKESEQRKCFNYKNLQPLWAKDNLSKGAKIAA